MMILALTVGLLIGTGAWMVLQREMVRAIFGLTLISHGVNLLLLTTGVPAWRQEPLTKGADIVQVADALPQAFVLTAIVIAMASSILMLALAVIGRDDDQTVPPETGEDH